MNIPATTDNSDQKVELLIYDLPERCTDSIYDTCVLNTDALFYFNKSPDNCLQPEKKDKNNKYQESCLQKRCYFCPCVVSVGGQLSVEAEDELKNMASGHTTKLKNPKSQTCGYIKIRVTIKLVRATHSYIQGSRVPVHTISVQRPQ